MLDLQSWSLGISGLLLQWKQGRYTHTHTHAHTHTHTHTHMHAHMQEPSFLLICFFWTSVQKHELFVWAG